MSSFIEELKSRGDISFLGMRNTAVSLLPNDRAKRDKLYHDLERGKGILDDDDHLNMYLHSFGKMHKAKLDAAFKTLPMTDIFSEKIEIYDWGCGQGTAIMCLFDYLSAKNINSCISKAILVEPSKAAIERAEGVIRCLNDSLKIISIVKDFDSLDFGDVKKSSTRKLHIFSNILDVEGFDLAKFIHLFQHQFKGENYFICVGPYYYNNRRVDEFVAACLPDTTYAIISKEQGYWQNEWSISMRTFLKRFDHIESIENIRQRIEDSHKKEQFFAGYVLDAIAEEFDKSDLKETIEGLYNSLSVFDVKSNISLGSHKKINPILAVLGNIISRGLPTKAPIYVENIFSDLYQVSVKPEENSILDYKSTHNFDAQEIYEALHIIDSRFDTSYYNSSLLESQFEYKFIFDYLKGTDKEYLIQLLEPQRMLSTIVDLPDKQFCTDQRVDFSMAIPYAEEQTGFIVELDGSPYHSNIFSRLHDENRDRMSSTEGWETYRIRQLDSMAFINDWELDPLLSPYLKTLKKNQGKQLIGKWREVIEVVLSPLAIARIERMIIEAMIAGILSFDANEWNILVVERDVPCASIAINDFKEKYEHASLLAGNGNRLPTINLEIVSTQEFMQSGLHLGNKPLLSIPQKHFELCIDIAMLLRDNIDILPLNTEADAVYIIRSAHRKKRIRTITTAENIQYPPFVEKDSSGLYINIPEREEVLTYFLRDIFRKPSFRPGQLPIISRALGDMTTIGLLPTGGGKSLTYQLSCILQPGVAIIVDPLVSLMVDQVRGLRNLRIDACDCVNSQMGAKEKVEKLNQLQNGSLMFMLLSPERFMMKNFRSSIQTMTEKNHIYFSYGIIDEVHCVSEWGHDFRPSYLHLGRNMIKFMHTKSKRPLSIVGLTATASFDVLSDVERELTLGGSLSIDSETIVRPESDTRPELTYRIIEVLADFDVLREDIEPYVLRKAQSDWNLKDVVAIAKKNQMYTLLDGIPSDLTTINQEETSISQIAHIPNFKAEHFFAKNNTKQYENAGIIFCPHAHGTFGVKDNQYKTSNGLSTELKGAKDNLEIATFVGGDHPDGDMKSFNDNLQNVMIATKAFGMGIDKPNVRYTIHYNHPSSIEGFVQEAGRGGRDRRHAISYVLYDSTQYIQFTIDKINDIRYLMGQDDPIWLEGYENKFVLAANLRELCFANGATDEQTNRIIEIIQQQNFLENVDKNINLWFHNNSFRGLYKEKVILLEFTDKLLNAKPSILTEIQGKLRDITGNEDVCLKASTQKNSITIFSQENEGKQYAYVFLNTLQATYKYANFDKQLCSSIANSLIEILKSYKERDTIHLLRPLREDGNEDTGIYKLLSNTTEEASAYIVVSWENHLQQDIDGFDSSIRNLISEISYSKGWADIDENRFGRFSINKIESFDQLVGKIAKCSGDSSWLRYHTDKETYSKLRNAFCKKRDKSDTDKAIYRLCCIGLVEDVTIDYLSQTYELKIRNRKDSEIKQCMLDYFGKYYSYEQAQRKVANIERQSGRNYIDKCLGYLTGFIYDTLEKKRYRAIDDMRTACEESIIERKKTGKDEWLKEFIHLYFNSKYAREDYLVDGQPYSLKRDTDTEGKNGFDIVIKYIKVVDPSIDLSGSEIDNVKHLYGATLLCLRAHPDNSALQLLLTYCITVLGSGGNKSLIESAYNNYIEGFMYMYHHHNVGSKLWEYVDYFNKILASKITDKDTYINEKIILEGKRALALLVYEEKFEEITKKYLENERDDI